MELRVKTDFLLTIAIYIYTVELSGSVGRALDLLVRDLRPQESIC